MLLRAARGSKVASTVVDIALRHVGVGDERMFAVNGAEIKHAIGLVQSGKPAVGHIDLNHAG